MGRGEGRIEEALRMGGGGLPVVTTSVVEWGATYVATTNEYRRKGRGGNSCSNDVSRSKDICELRRYYEKDIIYIHDY